MKMYDCDVCLSAGSVNKWGYCEICGEDFEDHGSKVVGGVFMSTASVLETSDHEEVLSGIGRDAA